MMASGQMMYVLGALALLSLLVLSVNKIIVENTSVMLENEASITAISLAQAMIDEIQTKEFDQNTVNARVYSTSGLTAVASLGPDAAESVPSIDTYSFQSASVFNDVDDYNNYQRKVSTPRLGDFLVRDSVYYLTESNLNQKSTSPTFYKKIVITVTHPNMARPIVLSDVAVYRRYI
jgi:hypothetical protein